jgi:hypothetical protein
MAEPGTMSDAELIEEAMLCAARYAQATASLDAGGRSQYRERGDQCQAELLRRLTRIPAPDRTGLADVHDAARAWMLHCLSYLDEVITLDCVVDTLLSDLAIGGFEITRATAPEAGRVTISDMQDRAEEALRPYIANPASRHLAAADAINAALAQAGTEGETE